MSFIKVNSRKILHAFQNIREIIDYRFYFVPSLSRFGAPEGLFKNGGDNINIRPACEQFDKSYSIYLEPHFQLTLIREKKPQVVL